MDGNSTFGNPVLDLVVVVILILVGGFFAASELALITVKRYRLNQLADDGNRAAASDATGRGASAVDADTARLSRALGGIRSPRRRANTGRPPRPPRASLPLCAPAARGR